MQKHTDESTIEQSQGKIEEQGPCPLAPARLSTEQEFDFSLPHENVKTALTYIWPYSGFSSCHTVIASDWDRAARDILVLMMASPIYSDLETFLEWLREAALNAAKSHHEKDYFRMIYPTGKPE